MKKPIIKSGNKVQKSIPGARKSPANNLSKKIFVWSYLKELKEEEKEIMAAIKKVLHSGQLILGENVRNFESTFARWTGCKYGIGVNSGTDALFLALKALGIGPEDEVITVSNTAVPTVAAIRQAGAIPRFVDVSPVDYLIDTDKIADVISPKTKAILPVHLYGQCVNMKPLTRIARQYKLYIIEDCAQSHGATYHGRKAGSMGHLAAFSFYPTKILGTYGDAGIITTKSKKLSEKLRKLRFYGMKKIYYAYEDGYNSRMDELHAAILLTKFNHLENYIHRRRQIARTYNDELGNTSLILPKEQPHNKHVYYAYVVRHPKRYRIMEKLRDAGIFVNINYPWPIHTMKGYRYLGYKRGDLPVTEKLAKQIFNLPVYPALSESEQAYVIDSLKSILKKI